MKERYKDFYRDYKEVIYLLVLALMVCLLIPLNWSDDKVFAVKVAEKSFEEFIKGSARPLIDGATYFFSKYHILWRSLNPFVLSTFAFCLCKYIPISKKQNIFICLTSLIPAMVLVDAGFIATTLNYLFPVTFGIISLLPILYFWNDRKIWLGSYFFAVPLIAYASNMQQMCVVMVILFGVSFICFALKKRFCVYALWGLILSAVGMAFSLYLNTVGTNNRMERSCKQYFPEFSKLNILQKIELGFSSTFYELTSHIRNVYFVFAAFVILIAVFISLKRKSMAHKIVAWGTVVLMFTVGICNLLHLNIYSIAFNNYQNFKVGKSTYIFSLVADIYFVLIICAVLYSLFCLLDRKSFWISLSALALGTVSRIIMGFSPTVWASGYRTFFIFVLSIIIVATMLIDQNSDT